MDFNREQNVWLKRFEQLHKMRQLLSWSIAHNRQSSLSNISNIQRKCINKIVNFKIVIRMEWISFVRISNISINKPVCTGKLWTVKEGKEVKLKKKHCKLVACKHKQIYMYIIYIHIFEILFKHELCLTWLLITFFHKYFSVFHKVLSF